MMEVLTGDPSGSRRQRIEPRTLIDKQMGHLDSCARLTAGHSLLALYAHNVTVLGFFFPLSCETFIFLGPDADKLL